MKLNMLLMAATIGLAGCEMHHVHHFNKNELAGCDCNATSMQMSGGQYLPLSDSENVKILPPIYQPISPYAHNAAQAPMYSQPPAPKVEMPEYYRLTPVDPSKMPQGNQSQGTPQGGMPMTQPMGYSPYYQQPMQPVQQPVMPIQMSSNSSKSSDSNIKTYLFQPAGGVVYQY